MRDSTDFVNQSGSGGAPGSYEATALPAASNPSWNAGGTPGAAELVDGVLRITTTAVPATTSYFNSNKSGGENFWANEVNPELGFTVEARLRIVEVDPNAPYQGAFQINLFNNNAAGRVDVVFGKDFILWRPGEEPPVFTGLDLTSELVDVRIAWDPAAGEDGAYSLWYNGNLLSDTLAPPASFGSTYLQFGDPSAQLGGISELAYLRWDTTGAYAPIPEPSVTTAVATLFAAAALLGLRRKVKREDS